MGALLTRGVDERLLVDCDYGVLEGASRFLYWRGQVGLVRRDGGRRGWPRPTAKSRWGVASGGLRVQFGAVAEEVGVDGFGCCGLA